LPAVDDAAGAGSGGFAAGVSAGSAAGGGDCEALPGKVSAGGFVGVGSAGTAAGDGAGRCIAAVGNSVGGLLPSASLATGAFVDSARCAVAGDSSCACLRSNHSVVAITTPDATATPMSRRRRRDPAPLADKPVAAVGQTTDC